jgi:hypothetical protein
LSSSFYIYIQDSAPPTTLSSSCKAKVQMFHDNIHATFYLIIMFVMFVIIHEHFFCRSLRKFLSREEDSNGRLFTSPTLADLKLPHDVNFVAVVLLLKYKDNIISLSMDQLSHNRKKDDQLTQGSRSVRTFIPQRPHTEPLGIPIPLSFLGPGIPSRKNFDQILTHIITIRFTNFFYSK